MTELITFEAALANSNGQGCGKKHLLLGNGFSQACKPNTFSYHALYDQADFKELSQHVPKVFRILSTKDFEFVIRALRTASALVKAYSPENKDLINVLKKDANGLKEILANTIAAQHPNFPSEIETSSYLSCRRFLSNFEDIYTLNYDLLLYWTVMQDGDNLGVSRDDGFRMPASGEEDYVTWDIERSDSQKIFYLHGALHIYDTGYELKKITWKNSGVPLIQQIRKSLDEDMLPLIVTEGKKEDKYRKIRHSDYLSRCYRSLSKIGGSLFVFGHSLAENDLHIIDAIKNNKIKKLFISIYGDPNSPENIKLINNAAEIRRLRPVTKNLEIFFFNAESAHVWH